MNEQDLDQRNDVDLRVIPLARARSPSYPARHARVDEPDRCCPSRSQRVDLGAKCVRRSCLGLSTMMAEPPCCKLDEIAGARRSDGSRAAVFDPKISIMAETCAEESEHGAIAAIVPRRGEKRSTRGSRRAPPRSLPLQHRGCGSFVASAAARMRPSGSLCRPPPPPPTLARDR